MLYKINCNTHDLKVIELLNKKLIHSAVVASISIQQTQIVNENWQDV